jgi:hypothetical protein
VLNPVGGGLGSSLRLEVGRSRAVADEEGAASLEATTVRSPFPMALIFHENKGRVDSLFPFMVVEPSIRFAPSSPILSGIRWEMQNSAQGPISICSFPPTPIAKFPPVPRCPGYAP